MFFSFFKLIRELRAGVDEMSDTLEDLAVNLDISLAIMRKCILSLTNSTYPNTLRCELDIYILD